MLYTMCGACVASAVAYEYENASCGALARVGSVSDVAGGASSTIAVSKRVEPRSRDGRAMSETPATATSAQQPPAKSAERRRGGAFSGSNI